jgi:hypothetical protein
MGVLEKMIARAEAANPRLIHRYALLNDAAAWQEGSDLFARMA